MNKEASQALGRAHWRKSSHSRLANNCVEVAAASGWVGIRDSKLGTDSPILTITTAEWAAFTAGVKDNEFDL
ncbi:MAG: DUF397 domain-containing protein [Pseudonocardia sp.]